MEDRAWVVLFFLIFTELHVIVIQTESTNEKLFFILLEAVRVIIKVIRLFTLEFLNVFAAFSFIFATFSFVFALRKCDSFFCVVYTCNLLLGNVLSCHVITAVLLSRLLG